MSNLIYEIKTNKIRAGAIFDTILRIHEDFIVLWSRHWFTVNEYTITYKHIVRAHLIKRIFFSNLQIMDSTGNENAIIKHVWNSDAIKAKKLIDQKINLVHSSEMNRKELESRGVAEIDNLEKSLGRLKELVAKGRLSEKEYEKRKKTMLGNMK
ncbi:hypothetical protein HYV31_01690 [candidate division WWE3 bacterium]|nr:hypothetical protein [candidate division WWE3 bacterium]